MYEIAVMLENDRFTDKITTKCNCGKKPLLKMADCHVIKFTQCHTFIVVLGYACVNFICFISKPK